MGICVQDWADSSETHERMFIWGDGSYPRIAEAVIRTGRPVRFAFAGRVSSGDCWERNGQSGDRGEGEDDKVEMHGGEAGGSWNGDGGYSTTRELDKERMPGRCFDQAI